MTKEEIAYTRGFMDACEIVFTHAKRFRRFQAMAMKLLSVSRAMLEEIDDTDKWRSVSMAGFSDDTIQELDKLREGT